MPILEFVDLNKRQVMPIMKNQQEAKQPIYPAVIGKSRLESGYSIIKKNLSFLAKIDSKFLDLHNILSFMVENYESYLFWFK